MKKTRKNITSAGYEPAYAAIGRHHNGYRAVIASRGKVKLYKLEGNNFEKPDSVCGWLSNYSEEHKLKIIASGLIGLEQAEKIAEKIWLKLDIVPHILKNSARTGSADIKKACYTVMKCYMRDNRPRVQMASRRRTVSSYLTTLDAYRHFSTSKEFYRIVELAERCKQKKIRLIFINATAAGGGVAHMRHAMMRLYRLLGVKVEWDVLKPDEEIFNITKKKFHNVLQAVAPPDCVLTAKDKLCYSRWIRDNFDMFRERFIRADCVVIDDPQPSGLIPHIRKINPKIKIIYRSHIQVQASLIDQRKTQQFTTWEYLWQFIKQADLFVSHPIPEFVPNTVKKNRLVYMPPSTDPLDGLNKHLSIRDKKYYLSLFNEHLKKNGQTPLDPGRPHLVQIARFDPSKGIHDVIESYRKLRDYLAKENVSRAKIPQLAIIGNGSIDDPEGVSIYIETRQTLMLDTYSHIADDIKVARLPHYDQLLNTLLDESLIAFQLSHKEGFEFKVTEALMKGKPVIAYKSGGIPLQISHGRTGFLVNAGQADKVAKYAKKLLLDRDYYKKISREAASTINHDYWTLNNSAKWLYLTLELCNKNSKLIKSDIGRTMNKLFSKNS